MDTRNCSEKGPSHPTEGPGTSELTPEGEVSHIEEDGPHHIKDHSPQASICGKYIMIVPNQYNLVSLVISSQTTIVNSELMFLQIIT